MARGGKREGAGRPVAQHTIEAEAAKAALVEAFVKDKDKIFAALIKRAKTADVPAIKELFDRVWGKAEQPITGKGGGAIELAWLNELQSPTIQGTGPKPSTPAQSAG